MTLVDELDASHFCAEQAAYRNLQHDNVLAWLDAHHDMLTSGQCPTNTQLKRVAALLNSVWQRVSHSLRLKLLSMCKAQA